MAKQKNANGDGTLYYTMKNGKKYYTATVTIGVKSDGKPLRKSFCGYSQKEVKKRMNDCINARDNGLLEKNNDYSVESWFHTWLFSFRSTDLKDTSFTKYDSLYRNYIKGSEIGSIKLSSLRATHLQEYYKKLLDSGISANIVRTINKHLGTSMNLALKQGLVMRNYCDLVTLPKASKKDAEKIKCFSEAEQRMFIASLNGNRNKPLYLTAFGCGLRIGEIMGLKWEDIDFNNSTMSIKRAISNISKVQSDGTRKWSVLEHTPKTETSIRTIPIPDALLIELKQHKKEQNKEKLKHGELYSDNGLVFCTVLGNYLDTRNLTRSYERLLKKIGIPYKSFHSLRHTYATRLFEHNVPVKTVQSLLGHKDITTTMNIYTHVMPEKMTNEIQCLNNILG